MKKILFYPSLAVLMALKFFPFGFRYFRYLDDYNIYGILYHRIRNGENPASLFTFYGLNTFRPYGGALNAFVMAPLWEHLEWALLVIILLHLAALPLIEYVFNYCKLPWGKAASVVFGLYPLLTESVYWVNPGSSLVLSVFLLALSAYALCVYFESGVHGTRVCYLLLALVAGVLSLGFYEQTVSFGAALYFLIILRAVRRPGANRPGYLWFLWPFVYIGAIGLYYAMFISGGRMAGNASLTTRPFAQIIQTLWAMARLIAPKQLYNLYALAKYEMPRILTQAQLYIVFAVGLLFSCLLSVSLRESGGGNETESPSGARKAINPLYITLCLSFLLLAAFGPFFILQTSYLNMRNLLYCVPVFAVIAQVCWDALIKKIPAKKRVLTCASAAVIFMFFLFNICGVSAVRENYKTDLIIAEQVLGHTRAGAYDRVWLFGAKQQYAPHGGANLESSTFSDWALTGLVNVLNYEQGFDRYLTEDGYYFNPVAEAYNSVEAGENDLPLYIEGATPPTVSVIPRTASR